LLDVLSGRSVAEGLERKSAKHVEAVFLTPKTQFEAEGQPLFEN
jgi:hypothetical protein